MKTIQLTKGKITLVDNDDYEYLNQFNWYAADGANTYYARRQIRIGGNKRITYHMHREILNVPDGLETDHRDGNGLNNQRYNLRICTHSQNSMNRIYGRKNRDGYRGIFWHDKSKLWVARITINKKYRYLGYYKRKEVAAIVYDLFARYYFGEFANPNFNCGINKRR